MPIKTYKKTIDCPRLVIQYDASPESPREWSNIGFFFTKEVRYQSPDGNSHQLYRIMMDTADDAKDTDDHIARMTTAAKDAGVDVKAIYPVYKYEHSGVVYRRGTASGFDYSNCGYYFVTQEHIKSVFESEPTTEEIERVIDGELSTYTKWANGEVYGFLLYDDNGELADSCGGFYDIEDIREYLPEEWDNEDLNQYIKQ